MIPALAIPFIAGWLTGDSVVSLIKANIYSDVADELDSQAVALVDETNVKVNEEKKIMETSVGALGKTKVELMSGNVRRVAAGMSAIHKNFKLNRDTAGLRELEKNNFTESTVSEIDKYSREALNIINAESKCSKTGTVEAVGVGALGGCLTIGLGYLVASPFVFLYGRSKVEDAEAAVYEAATKLEQAHLYAERMENVRELFKAVSERGDQINKLLIGLNRYLTPAVADFEKTQSSYGGAFRSYPVERRHNVFFAWQLTQTIKNIIDTPLVGEDCSLNVDMERPLSNGQKVLALLSDAH